MEAVVRLARRSDKAPLMSFIKDVWGGHDYIPYVWDRWMSDRENEVYVVEVGGVPVGMSRLRFLEDGSAWFEGARVHPAYRGQGLATMLGENSMEAARRRGVKVFRLTSGSRNRAAHRQIARIRFAEVAKFSAYVPTKKRGTGRVARRGAMERSADAYRLIEGSFEFRAGRGFFWHNWGAASLTPEVVRALVGEGSVYRRGGAVAVYRSGGSDWEEVGFVGGDPSDAVALVRSLVGRAKKTEESWVFLPQRSPIIRALREAGFKRMFSNILFERRAAKG